MNFLLKHLASFLLLTSLFPSLSYSKVFQVMGLNRTAQPPELIEVRIDPDNLYNSSSDETIPTENEKYSLMLRIRQSGSRHFAFFVVKLDQLLIDGDSLTTRGRFVSPLVGEGIKSVEEIFAKNISDISEFFKFFLELNCEVNSNGVVMRDACVLKIYDKPDYLQPVTVIRMPTLLQTGDIDVRHLFKDSAGKFLDVTIEAAKPNAAAKSDRMLKSNKIYPSRQSDLGDDNTIDFSLDFVAQIIAGVAKTSAGKIIDISTFISNFIYDEGLINMTNYNIMRELTEMEPFDANELIYWVNQYAKQKNPLGDKEYVFVPEDLLDGRLGNSLYIFEVANGSPSRLFVLSFDRKFIISVDPANFAQYLNTSLVDDYFKRRGGLSCSDALIGRDGL